MATGLSLHFLGTGTITPDPQRSCSGTLLDTPKERILVDAGAGTLRRLAEAGIPLHGISYLFITHFHPDHVGDLIPLIFALRNIRPPEVTTPLRIWGPAGLRRFMQGMERAYGKWVSAGDEQVKIYELKRRLLDFPGFRVIWGHVLHTQESVGYRFEIGGKVLGFSGDSGYCEELIRLFKDADLAVLECSHADEFAVKGHLSPSLAARIAQEAGVKKMVLNHFYPDALNSNLMKVASKYFPGEIVLAADGDIISINS